MTLLEAALRYQAKGFSVIPVGNDKVPLVKWEPYQKRKATQEEIREWWGKNPKANIGLVTGEISNLLAVDCDTPEATQRIQEAIPDSLTVPCQKTPRGGMHFLFSHTPGFSNRAGVAKGIDIRTTGGYLTVAPSVNGTGNGWEWVVSIFDADPPNLILAVRDILNTSFSLSLYREPVTSKKEGKSPEVTEVTTSHKWFELGNRNETLFHIANQLIKTKTNDDLVRQVMNIIAKNCYPPFSDKETELVIKSAMDRAEKRERNITQELRDWITESQRGHFQVTDWSREAHVVTKEDKHALNMALKRLCDKKVLEKTGFRTGQYRIIETEVEFMDFVNVDKEGSIPLTLPLEIHKKTIFFPRNVIVIAGVTGYGKTTYLLNVIRDNMHKFKFRYFASEMSALAMNFKLSKFNFPIEKWKFDVIPDQIWDYTNIQDKIFPDDINVIDYLEPEGEKTYNIHGVISKIISKLDKGMALIATQKRKDADLSAGGVYSAKAASLYLSLDWGTIFIFKNRFREVDPAPKLTRIDFNIEAGQNFVPTSDWYDPINKKKEKIYDRFDKD